ncbi:MAG: DUF503 domain-containing protein [Eubacteriaceae bacterium]|nr:DUF503 domain-containing protein [Eubacteriaceae bacterium]
MFVLAAEIEVKLFATRSLKEKRSIIKSIVEKLKKRFSMSVIESGDHELWQKSRIGFSFCSLDEAGCNERLETILEFIEVNSGAETISVKSEISKL